MGADKEATDLWIFGRPRPDLTAEETFAESGRRHKLIEEHAQRRTGELMQRAPDLIARAKAHQQQH